MSLARPLAVLLALTASASAYVPRPTVAGRVAAEELTALPAAKLARPLRTHVERRFAVRRTPAWQQFQSAAGGRWRAAYDPATGVPSRIWGSGIAAPGTIASAQIAEQTARALLAQHVALLAPGATAADFTLVANHLANGVRSVGFVQHAGGIRVIGGQVSFRFKHDRLVAIGSEALPDVRFDRPRSRLSRAALASRATTALRVELALPNAPVSPPGDEVVLPLVADDMILGYRLVRPVVVDGGIEGRYLAYVDVTSGEPLAARQLNAYATGTLLYRTVDRHPGRPRIDRPAQRAHVSIAGAAITTSMTGALSWTPDSAQVVTTAVVGDLVKIVNKATTEGTLAVADISIEPNGTVVWDATAVPEDDAQLNVFVATNIVKDFVRGELDPTMTFLDEQLTANVNIGQECNAFWDGKAMIFVKASENCQNTGLVQDVVFHEFGHALHQHQIIEGVGAFDGAMSEGASDTLAAFITNDSGMGRGFRYSDQPLRELDPPTMEYRWPEDVKEIHHTGMIFGGAFWDLRRDLIAHHGEVEGKRIVHRLFLGALRRSVDIPTSLVEILVEDDDDGNLDNGTPNECFIRTAFGRHGLRTVAGSFDAPATLATRSRSQQVTIELDGLSTRCDSDAIATVTVDWRPTATSMPQAGSTLATRTSLGRYYVQLPLALENTVLYRARIVYEDGSTLTLADNLASQYYQLYQGTTVPLYCTDFEDEDPFATGWSTGNATLGETSSWTWGTSLGMRTDPPAAFSGTRILGQNLEGDYDARHTTWVKMPEIDVGKWTDVRLQYRRWLAVEDSHYDQARVTVNGEQIWLNYTANDGVGLSTDHVDREWRFHDTLLSGWSPSRKLTVGWELDPSDGGQLGGWHLDDVCIVANVNSICGDGVKSPTEACDEGHANSDEPDASCRTFCLRATCGDGIVDSSEECDRGPADNTCSAQCTIIELPTLGGCCSASGGPAGSFVLSLVAGALLVRRRRRR